MSSRGRTIATWRRATSASSFASTRRSSPPPRALGLFDDVLTTGAHFKAAQQVLLARFPGTPIAGIFLARTPPPAFPGWR